MTTHYQTDTSGIYIGPVEAWPDPVDEDRWLVPFGAYADTPPSLSEHQAAKRVDDSWVVVVDYRGFEYWTADRVKHRILEVGVEPPTGYLSADPGPTAAQLAAKLVADAKTLLQLSDVTVTRCFEAGVSVPANWRDYRAALRAVVATGTGALPTRPEYPSGT
jgi:hypothetical protein